MGVRIFLKLQVRDQAADIFLTKCRMRAPLYPLLGMEVCLFREGAVVLMLKKPQRKALPCQREKAATHTSPLAPPSAVGACRTAGWGPDGEQTPICSPGEALTAALTRGVTFRFV